MKTTICRVVCIALLLLGIAAYGQTGNGSISGRVSDSSGAIVPEAAVVVTNSDTGIKTEVKTNAEGLYQALQLIPGPYTIDVEFKGFKKAHRTGIQVQVSDRLTIDFALTVGDSTEIVEVQATAPLLRTEDAQTGEVIGQGFIQNMPQLDRDPLRLLVLSGNIQGDGSRAGNNNSDTRINGGRTSGVEYFVDGITAGTGGGHHVIANQLTPSMEGVNEFKVITNGISAEYGRVSGGAVEIVTRSGTNGLHGQLFEYFQNDKLNASSWQQNSLGGKKTPFHNNDFGFAFGGPVLVPKVYNGKDKTFFFVNYEGTRFRQAGNLRTASVPTQAERNGDFTNTMYDGVPTLMRDPYGAQAFNAEANKWERLQLLGGDGKHVPQNQIAPLITELWKRIPMPTPGYGRANTSSAQNYVAAVNTASGGDSMAVRMDQSLNTNQRLFIRFQGGSYDQGDTRVMPLWGAPENHVNGGRAGSIGYDWSLTPTTLLNIKAGVDHNPLINGSAMPSDFNNSGIPWDPQTAKILGDKGVPMVRSTFMGETQLMAGCCEGVNTNYSTSTTYHAGVSMTKIMNRHTLKFGYEHRRYYDNYFTSITGDVTFNTNPVLRFAEDNDWNSQAFANSLGSTELGIADWFWMHGPQTQAMNFNYHGAYAQDDFKVNSKLTLNLGVRWDVETPTTERHDKLYFWDPTAQSQFKINSGYDFKAALARAGMDPNSVPVPSWVTNGFPQGAIRIANTPEFPGRSGQTTNPAQFAPRIGMAYQLTPKTVFRGSFGKMYLSSSGDANAMISGGAGIATYDSADAGWHASNDGMRHIISTLAHPYQPTDVTSYTRDNNLANFQSTGSVGPGAWSMNSHMPYELTWNAGIQRELPNRFLFEMNYSANRGIRLLAPDLISRFPKQFLNNSPAWVQAMTTMIDSPTAGQTRSDAVVGPQQMLAFMYFSMPYYGSVNVLGVNQGQSMYNSANFRLERRFANGVSFLANYTLSRLNDNVGGPELSNGGIANIGVGGKHPQSVDSVASVYGLSPLDETHRFSLTYSVELPFGRGKHFLNSPATLGQKFADAVIGGWQISGFTIYRSGRPVVWTAGNQNVNNNIRDETTYGSYASSDHNLAMSGFTSNRQVLVSSQDPRNAGMVRAFDPSKVLDAQSFVYGTLPPVDPSLRNPGNTQTDLSLMKKFSFSSDGRRYFQLRMEALNALNARGYGNINSTINSPDFGLITSAGHTERRMQVSGRLFF